jgi:hypothetical protein
MSEEIEVTNEMLLEPLLAWKDYLAGIEALSAEGGCFPASLREK